MKNQLFRNRGSSGSGGSRGSVTFEDVSRIGGPAFQLAEVSRGAAFGDIDNDGDIDILVTTNDGPVRLLINESRAKNHWIQVKLEQTKGDRFALGARVGIERAGQPTIWRRVKTDGSYLVASDLRVHAGLSVTPKVDAVLVQWPDATRERWTNVQEDRVITLRRGTGAVVRSR